MSPATNNHSPVAGHPDEINLLAYWRVIVKYKKMIVGIVVVASVVAVIVSLCMTKYYKAEALIVPVSSGGGGGLGSLASQFGGLASLVGVNLSGGGGSDATKFVTILKSRTLSESVIEHENLMPILFDDVGDKNTTMLKGEGLEKMPSMEAAVKSLKGLVTVTEDKKKRTIVISVISREPKVAARIANAYIRELQRFININALTTSKRNRLFIEGQLAQNKEELLEAGKEINEFYKGNRVSVAEAKVDVPIFNRGLGSDVPGSKTEIRESGKALIEMNDSGEVSDSVALSNHEVQVPSAKIESILSQKADIEQKIDEARTVKDVPQQVYLTYLMMRRELLARVNALLTTQYEMAKIEEAKEDLAFQVIDYAVPPIQRFKPRRGQICMMAFFAAFFFAVILAFLREYIEKMRTVTRKP